MPFQKNPFFCIIKNRLGRRVPRVAKRKLMHEYKTKNTCSTKINFELNDGKVYSVSFKDGCDGNLKAIGILVEGTDAEELVKKLKGLCCGRKKTSCADQLADALERALRCK
jgi:uncharacterized protein (TIGR03905 family)